MGMIDRKLEIFRMAAELKNFSETAAALGMTQPNVTQQIALLEKDLGAILFDRTGRRLELTSAGTELRKECARLFADAGEIRRRIRNASHAVRHYRLGGTMTAGGALLPEIAAEYMKLHPESRIGLHVANTREISDLLKKRILDLALVEGPFDRNYFFSMKLLSDELKAVGAPGSLPKKRFSLRKYLRDGGRLVLREEGSGTRFAFDSYLAGHGIPRPDEDSVILVNSFDAIKQFLRNGCGITIISVLAAADELKTGTLEAADFTEGILLRDMHYIWTADADQKFADSFTALHKKCIQQNKNGNPVGI